MPMFSHILTQEGPYKHGKTSYFRNIPPKDSKIPGWVLVLAGIFPTWEEEEDYIPEVFGLTEEEFAGLPKEVRAMLQFLVLNAEEEDDLNCEDIPHNVWEVLKDRMKELDIPVLHFYDDIKGYGPHLGYHPEAGFPTKMMEELPDVFLERQHWDNTWILVKKV